MQTGQLRPTVAAVSVALLIFTSALLVAVPVAGERVLTPSEGETITQCWWPDEDVVVASEHSFTLRECNVRSLWIRTPGLAEGAIVTIVDSQVSGPRGLRLSNRDAEPLMMGDRSTLRLRRVAVLHGPVVLQNVFAEFALFELEEVAATAGPASFPDEGNGGGDASASPPLPVPGALVVEGGNFANSVLFVEDCAFRVAAVAPNNIAQALRFAPFSSISTELRLAGVSLSATSEGAGGSAHALGLAGQHTNTTVLVSRDSSLAAAFDSASPRFPVTGVFLMAPLFASSSIVFIDSSVSADGRLSAVAGFATSNTTVVSASLLSIRNATVSARSTQEGASGIRASGSWQANSSLLVENSRFFIESSVSNTFACIDCEKAAGGGGGPPSQDVPWSNVTVTVVRTCVAQANAPNVAPWMESFAGLDLRFARGVPTAVRVSAVGLRIAPRFFYTTSPLRFASREGVDGFSANSGLLELSCVLQGPLDGQNITQSEPPIDQGAFPDALAVEMPASAASCAAPSGQCPIAPPCPAFLGESECVLHPLCHRVAGSCRLQCWAHSDPLSCVADNQCTWFYGSDVCGRRCSLAWSDPDLCQELAPLCQVTATLPLSCVMNCSEHFNTRSACDPAAGCALYREPDPDLEDVMSCALQCPLETTSAWSPQPCGASRFCEFDAQGTGCRPLCAAAHTEARPCAEDIGWCVWNANELRCDPQCERRPQLDSRAACEASGPECTWSNAGCLTRCEVKYSMLIGEWWEQCEEDKRCVVVQDENVHAPTSCEQQCLLFSPEECPLPRCVLIRGLCAAIPTRTETSTFSETATLSASLPLTPTKTINKTDTPSRSPTASASRPKTMSITATKSTSSSSSASASRSRAATPTATQPATRTNSPSRTASATKLPPACLALSFWECRDHEPRCAFSHLVNACVAGSRAGDTTFGCWNLSLPAVASDTDSCNSSVYSPCRECPTLGYCGASACANACPELWDVLVCTAATACTWHEAESECRWISTPTPEVTPTLTAGPLVTATPTGTPTLVPPTPAPPTPAPTPAPLVCEDIEFHECPSPPCETVMVGSRFVCRLAPTPAPTTAAPPATPAPTTPVPLTYCEAEFLSTGDCPRGECVLTAGGNTCQENPDWIPPTPLPAPPTSPPGPPSEDWCSEQFALTGVCPENETEAGRLCILVPPSEDSPGDEPDCVERRSRTATATATRSNAATKTRTVTQWTEERREGSHTTLTEATLSRSAPSPTVRSDSVSTTRTSSVDDAPPTRTATPPRYNPQPETPTPAATPAASPAPSPASPLPTQPVTPIFISLRISGGGFGVLLEPGRRSWLEAALVTDLSRLLGGEDAASATPRQVALLLLQQGSLIARARAMIPGLTLLEADVNLNAVRRDGTFTDHFNGVSHLYSDFHGEAAVSELALVTYSVADDGDANGGGDGGGDGGGAGCGVICIVGVLSGLMVIALIAFVAVVLRVRAAARRKVAGSTDALSVGTLSMGPKSHAALSELTNGSFAASPLPRPALKKQSSFTKDTMDGGGDVFDAIVVDRLEGVGGLESQGVVVPPERNGRSVVVTIDKEPLTPGAGGEQGRKKGSLTSNRDIGDVEMASLPKFNDIHSTNPKVRTAAEDTAAAAAPADASVLPVASASASASSSSTNSSAPPTVNKTTHASPLHQQLAEFQFPVSRAASLLAQCDVGPHATAAAAAPGEEVRRPSLGSDTCDDTEDVRSRCSDAMIVHNLSDLRFGEGTERQPQQQQQQQRPMAAVDAPAHAHGHGHEVVPRHARAPSVDPIFALEEDFGVKRRGSEDEHSHHQHSHNEMQLLATGVDPAHRPSAELLRSDSDSSSLLSPPLQLGDRHLDPSTTASGDLGSASNASFPSPTLPPSTLHKQVRGRLPRSRSTLTGRPTVFQKMEARSGRTPSVALSSPVGSAGTSSDATGSPTSGVPLSSVVLPPALARASSPDPSPAPPPGGAAAADRDATEGSDAEQQPQPQPPELPKAPLPHALSVLTAALIRSESRDRSAAPEWSPPTSPLDRSGAGSDRGSRGSSAFPQPRPRPQ